MSAVMDSPLADSGSPIIQRRRKKNVKKVVLFSLMVCGASGTGKLIASDI
jgi:septin family protein